MSETLNTDEIMELAARVGQRVAREYPGIEADDITSAALLHFYDSLERHNSTEEAYLYKVMYGAGLDFASKERKYFQTKTSKFIYRPIDVKGLLESYFDPAKWTAPSVEDDLMEDGISEGTRGASLMDLKSALEGLKLSHKDVLIQVFHDGDEPRNRMALTRAIDALTARMNGKVSQDTAEHEGPGSRKVLSSTVGQHIASSHLDDDGYNTRDAVADYQNLRIKSPSQPPGTFYNWGGK